MKKSYTTLVLILGGVVFLLLAVLITIALTRVQRVVIEPAGQQPAPLQSSIPSSPAASAQPSSSPQPVASKKLPVLPQGRILHFTSYAEKRCEVGDIDTIEKDLGHSSSARLIFTMESLIPGDHSFQPIVSEVTTAQLKGGYQASFLLPDNVKTYHLGLFLCSDSRNINRCLTGDKAVGDVGKVYEEYMGIEEKQRYQQKRALPVSRETIEAEDRIYFFNYLLVDGDQLTAVDSTAPAEAYRQLKTRIRETSPSAAQADKIAEAVEKLNSELRSMPVGISGRDMKINFPVFDKYECPAAKKALERIRQYREAREGR